MTVQIGIVLALLLVALVLFGLERIPIEIVAILLVMALVLTNTLTPAALRLALPFEGDAR